METTFNAVEPITVDLKLNGGTAHLVAERGAPCVTVRLTGNPDYVDRFTVTYEAARLVVRAPETGPGLGAGLLGLLQPGTQRFEAQITVPAGSDLHCVSGSTDVVVQGDWAVVDARQGSGSLNVEHAHTLSSTSGSGSQRIHRVDADARIHSGSGSIRIGSVGGSLDATNGSGGIVVADTVAGEAKLKTGSGGLKLGTLSGYARLRAGSGSVQAERLRNGGEIRTGSGGITLGEASGDLYAGCGSGAIRIGRLGPGDAAVEAASGAVRVAVAPKTPIWTDVHTSSGAIRNSIAPVGEPEPGEPTIRLRARTTSGSITLETAV